MASNNNEPNPFDPNAPITIPTAVIDGEGEEDTSRPPSSSSRARTPAQPAPPQSRPQTGPGLAPPEVHSISTKINEPEPPSAEGFNVSPSSSSEKEMSLVVPEAVPQNSDRSNLSGDNSTTIDALGQPEPEHTSSALLDHAAPNTEAVEPVESKVPQDQVEEASPRVQTPPLENTPSTPVAPSQDQQEKVAPPVASPQPPESVPNVHESEELPKSDLPEKEAPLPSPKAEDPTPVVLQMSTEKEKPGTQEPPQLEPTESPEKESISPGLGFGLSDDFYHDEFKASGAIVSQMPVNTLELWHSLGYDCKKFSNLYMIDKDVAIFAAGNVVVLLNLSTKAYAFLRTQSGGGIGDIAVHPSFRYFAVAEKGKEPNIIIYEYPSLRVFRVLKRGAQLGYAHITFNAAGDKMASVGSSPDFLLIVWDWKQEAIILRTKAFSSDVWRVSFAPENDGQLTTSGPGHIRFWKMAATFTGMKLQGQIGKFGRTELSDIAGYCELPDGKVLSGTEWGNLLLWDGGFIKCEIARKGRKYCHQGPIECIYLHEGDVITAGADGFIRMWDLDTIDAADTSDGACFELDPMSERKLGPDVHIKSLTRFRGEEADDEDHVWYAQDAKGGIWRVDLGHDLSAKPPAKLFSFHSGGIRAISSAPLHHYVASLGADGSIRLCDYLSKAVTYNKTFSSPGQSLLWAPLNVDPSGRTLVAGFNDGVVRVFKLVRPEELTLVKAFKAHPKAVSQLSFSPDGKYFVSCCVDRSIFFFNVDALAFSPLGFIEAPASILNCRWTTIEGAQLMFLCMANGVLAGYSPPERDKYDISHTYDLGDYEPTKVFKYKSIKDQLIAAKLAKNSPQKPAGKGKEGKEKAKADQEKEKTGDESQEGADKSEGKEGDGKKEEKEKEEKTKRQVNAPLNDVMFTSRGTFLLAVGGSEAGYLYECSFDMETPLMGYELSGEDVEVTTIRPSHRNGDYLLLGSRDGRIIVTPTSDMKCSYSLPMHDLQYGNVTGVTSSFDDSFVFSVGEDGNYFIYKACLSGVETLPVEVSPLEEARAVLVEDITDAKAYSIEEAKQKAEIEKKQKSAEEKKAEERQEIKKLRKEFEKLLSENAELPAVHQLKRDEFEIDPQLRLDIERSNEAKVAQLRAEMAFELERHTIAHQKLQERFIDPITGRRFVVKAFMSDVSVSSFLVVELSKDFKKQANPIFSSMTKLLLKLDKARKRIASRSSGMLVPPPGEGVEVANDTNKVESKDTSKRDGLNPLSTLPPISSSSSSDVKKEKRAARKAEWEAMMASKPDEKSVNPRDLQLLKEVEQNQGDYKLKTSSEYFVPVELRVNTQKKRQQLVDMRKELYERRTAFNSKLVDLRARKVREIEKMKFYCSRLTEVLTELNEPLDDVPLVPDLTLDELPEMKLQYTKEMLDEFKEEYVKILEREKAAAGGGGFGEGFGGFGGGGGGAGKKPQGQDQAKPEEPTDASRQAAEEQADQEEEFRSRAASLASLLSSPSRQSLFRKSVAEKKMSIMSMNELSTIEKDQALFQHTMLCIEKEKLLQLVHETMFHFDRLLLQVSEIKTELEAKLKFADFNHVLMYQELRHLRVFDEREKLLESRRNTKMLELTECQNGAKTGAERLAAKKNEIAILTEKEKQVQLDFTMLLGDKNKFEKVLTKIFKKKIKRAKLNEEGDEESDEEDDDDENYMSSDEEGGDDEDDEFDDTVCPAGCDPELYAKIIELRETRVDVEDALAEEKKSFDLLKREVEGYGKKEKIIQSALTIADSELTAFQLEKQAKLNEIDVAIPLSLHQIKYFENDAVPKDLQDALLFLDENVDKLKGTIEDLTNQKLSQRKEFQEIRHLQHKLQHEKKTKEATVAELATKCNEMQLLKFGALIDIEALENTPVNHVGIQLRSEKEKLDSEQREQLAAVEKDIDRLKDMLIKATRENTDRLNLIADLRTDNIKLEQFLDTNQRALKTDASRVKDILDAEERGQLVDLVEYQRQEAEMLKEEIRRLSSKTGHVAPPRRDTLPPIA